MSAIVVQLADGAVELRDWPPWALQVIEELLILADPNLPDGPARDRLFQVANEESAEEWRKNVHPELFALLASAREIVTKDLAGAKRGRGGRLRRMRIEREHLPAWISALQTARLHLAAAFDVDAAAMRAPLDTLRDDVRGVVLRIDLLAELQYHLLRGVDPESAVPPPGAGGPVEEEGDDAADEDDDDDGPSPPPPA